MYKRSPRTTKRLILVSQVYPPDPTAVGQHFADLTIELATRGWHVLVLSSNRGYDNPATKFRAYEELHGVTVKRLSFSSFGKGSIPIRLAGQLLFSLQALTYCLTARKYDVVVSSTSPPFAGFVGAILHKCRGAKLLWWVMDINPDQTVATRKLRHNSLLVRIFEQMNRVTLRRADKVVTLDHFMAERLKSKAETGGKLEVVPPWAHADPTLPKAGKQPGEPLGQSFRRRHGLDSRFVVMYSGNHGIQHPLTTLLKAASHLRDDPRIAFVFVGGGAGKEQVEQAVANGLQNVLSLPYQPLSGLSDSLSAADIHVVTMSDDAVGIIHPCKIYGALAVGRPVLFFGPQKSHAGEIVEPHDVGWRVTHGDVDKAVAVIRHAASLDRETLANMGKRASDLITDRFSRRALIARMADIVDGMASDEK